MAEKDTTFFAVRDLPERTKKLIKRFAVEYDVTMAQALEFLIEIALGDEELVRRYMDTIGTHNKFNDKTRTTPAQDLAAICEVIRLREAQRGGAELTDDQEWLIKSWNQADRLRILHNPRYLDERLALERREQAAKRVEEEDKP